METGDTLLLDSWSEVSAQEMRLSLHCLKTKDQLPPWQLNEISPRLNMLRLAQIWTARCTTVPPKCTAMPRTSKNGHGQRNTANC